MNLVDMSDTEVELSVEFFRLMDEFESRRERATEVTYWGDIGNGVDRILSQLAQLQPDIRATYDRWNNRRDVIRAKMEYCYEEPVTRMIVEQEWEQRRGLEQQNDTESAKVPR